MQSSNTPDSHKISLKIIEAIRQHPVLYISEVKGNTIKLQEFRQKVWKRISAELGLDPAWVKLKWKNLRDTYCRILKYKNKSPKGLRRKKWIFEDHLSFLKFPYEPNFEAQIVELTDEYINDINTEVISSQDLLEQLEDNEEDDDYSEYLEILEENTNLEETKFQEHLEINDDNILLETNNKQIIQQPTVNTISKEIHSKFRKIKPKNLKYPKNKSNNKVTQILIKNQSMVPVSQKITTENIPNVSVTKIVTLKNPFDYKNSTDNFCTSMAQTIKKLPPKAQADIKMEICKIVSEAEIRYSGKNSLQNAQKYTKMPGIIPKLVLVPCQMIDNPNTYTKKN